MATGLTTNWTLWQVVGCGTSKPKPQTVKNNFAKFCVAQATVLKQKSKFEVTDYTEAANSYLFM